MMLENLEQRSLMSAASLTLPPASDATLVKNVLNVRGTPGADTIKISAGTTANTVAVQINAINKTFTRAQFKQLVILGDTGNDTITVDLSATLASKLGLKVLGEAGNDTITTNVAGAFDGGDGNDSITGSTGKDKILGGAGDDTIFSGGSTDGINAGDGVDKVTYANGDQDVGDIKLRTDAKGKLTITGSKAAEKFVFAKGTGNLITVTVGTQVASFDLTKVSSITLNGAGGVDEAVTPANVFGTKVFSKKSIEK